MAASAFATIADEMPDVTRERDRRIRLWNELKSKASEVHSASELNELRVFYGGRGIWVHKEVTGGIGSSPAGVTVGLLHTGSSYADDLHEDGVIYHYPQTSVPGRDQAEVDATQGGHAPQTACRLSSLSLQKGTGATCAPRLGRGLR
jgi:hypothetical protein